MQTEVPALLPCPFCGRRAHLEAVGKGGSRCFAAVFCEDNLCPGVAHGTGPTAAVQRASAVARWNTRPVHYSADVSAEDTATLAPKESNVQTYF
jgi:hypothetical protein